jgi:hypothetical protein
MRDFRGLAELLGEGRFLIGSEICFGSLGKRSANA